MPNHLQTRRDALKLVCVSAVAAGVQAGPANRAGLGLVISRATEARYFGLGAVRLREGPFLDAQRRDANYLLRLDADRMLANFRNNAGLQPKAPVYGGWESVEPWIWIRCHGHTLGHYLGAAACMYRSTGDERFAQRVDYLVSELAQCQRKTGGWLTAFPDGVAPLLDSLAGREFAGVPWYTTHKVMAGLRDAHLHRGSAAALDVWQTFADWVYEATRDVPEERFQKMLDREHGGMTEVFADLFEITGKPRYRDLALRFVHRAISDPLARREDRLDGLHANTQIPKVIGLQRIYEVDGPAEYHGAAEFFWKTVVETRSFATGGHGDGEHFFPRNEFPAHLHSAKTMETCCTHNMLRLTRALYAEDARCQYFDYFERALFNGILASQDPDSGMMTYFQSTRPGYVKLFHTPFDSFWCCTGSGMENHARYGESIYAYADDALFVNLFMASTLHWRERGLTITQSTSFPDQDRVTLEVSGARAQRIALRIRHPGWCERMSIWLNGKRVGDSSSPGSYYTLPTKGLRPGDTIELHLPMQLRLEPLPDAPDHAAVMIGPIVLAGVVGKPVNATEQLIVNERKSGEMLADQVEVPAWPRSLAELPAHFTRTSPAQLTFIAAGFTGGPVQFIPWFRVAHERYNLYWRGTASA